MNSRRILEINLKKSWREYEIFLMLIIALELFMIIYGILSFDLGSFNRRLYFFGYIFLLLNTVCALFIHHSSMKHADRLSIAIVNAYFYSALLIHWSSFISALDIAGGGYPVTYMTIIAAVSSTVVLYPAFYFVILLSSASFMSVVFTYYGNCHMPFTFYLNLAIFLIVMMFVETRYYRNTRQQYLLNEKLEELAWIDTLTHVENRRSLNKRMENLSKEGICYSFALIDVDHFKCINDTCGHREGDCCLIDISALLRESFPDGVYRYGGDEFAVISFEKPHAVAEKIDTVNSRLKKRPTEYVLQISSGIYYNDQGLSEEKVFNLADSALYEAKETRKSKSVIYRKDL